MAYWSVYVGREDEVVLKRRIEQVAKKNHWSFSQAVMVLLREHLLEERNRISEGEAWSGLATASFFEFGSERDSVYDSL